LNHKVYNTTVLNCAIIIFVKFTEILNIEAKCRQGQDMQKRGRIEDSKILIYIYIEELRLKKRFLKDCIQMLLAVFAVSIICPEKAFAYLDPGTGSMILQVILAGAVGVGCTVKVWRDKIMHFFKKDKNEHR